jgi:hypothetical protein
VSPKKQEFLAKLQLTQENHCIIMNDSS